jgi:hypothetical protein
VIQKSISPALFDTMRREKEPDSTRSSRDQTSSSATPVRRILALGDRLHFIVVFRLVAGQATDVDRAFRGIDANIDRSILVHR